MRYIAAILLCFYLISGASAQETSGDSDRKSDSFFSDFSSREYMTGDWGGARERLIDWGLTPTATYSASILGNPVGGIRKGIKYAGLLDVYLDFDLEKLLDIHGTRFVISGAWSSGKSLSLEDIGNFFIVSSDYNGNSVSLYQLYIETNLWGDRVKVAVGRMGIGDYFATAEVFEVYVSSSFDLNPISLTYNVPAFLSNPFAALGARLRVKPFDDFYIAAGVYSADLDAGRILKPDIDFTFRNGVILISEVGYTPGSRAVSSGLRGDYKLGAYYDTGKSDRLSEGGRNQEGNYGFYLIMDQMVYREQGAGSQGLTLWGTTTYAPQDEINTFPFFFSWGFVYEGVFSGRDNDIAGFGFAYGRLSSALADKDYEIGFEGTYIFQVTPWLGIQPDVQFIVHPGGSGDIHNAFVAGMQLSVDI
jgi:porin